jgi:Methyltransferase domain
MDFGSALSSCSIISCSICLTFKGRVAVGLKRCRKPPFVLSFATGHDALLLPALPFFKGLCHMTESLPNDQYTLAQPDSLSVRIAVYQRRRMYNRFITESNVCEKDRLLDVGVTSDHSYASSNYLESWYPNKQALTVIGPNDAAFLTQLYPGLKYVKANGLSMPFKDLAFDVVHSSAVIEHVGSFDNQIKFVQESCRVSRRSVFLTTPNRWFPMEFHCVLPLVHWLPKPMFRELMRRSGRSFLADECNLNLMDAKSLKCIARQVEGFKLRVSSIALGGWPANLILSGNRTPLKRLDDDTSPIPW